MKADFYLPGGMPLGNVNCKGGKLINEATAIVPPAIAAGAAKGLIKSRMPASVVVVVLGVVAGGGSAEK